MNANLNAGRSGQGYDQSCSAKIEPRSLDVLIHSVVAFVDDVRSARYHATDLADKLLGAMPQPAEATAGGASTPNGMLDALDRFQRTAWSELDGLKEQLRRIAGGLS